MSDQLQVSRYSAVRRRVFSLVGRDMLSVDSHAIPYVLLEDLTAPYLRPQADVATWSRSIAIGAVAGQRPYAQILMTPLSQPGNTLLVIEGVIIVSGSISAFDLGFATSEAAGTLTALASRQITIAGGPTWLSSGTVAAPVVPPHAQVNVPVAGQMVVVGPPLFPFMQVNETGFGSFKVVGVAALNAVTITLFGFNRSLADGEL